MLTNHACVCVHTMHACVSSPVHVCMSRAWMSVFGGGAARGMYYTSKKGQAQTQSRAKG